MPRDRWRSPFRSLLPFPASCTGPLGKPSGPLGAPSTRDRAVDGESGEEAVLGTRLPQPPLPLLPSPIPPPLPPPPSPHASRASPAPPPQAAGGAESADWQVRGGCGGTPRLGRSVCHDQGWASSGPGGLGWETALCPQEQPQGLALMRRGACKPMARADPTTHHQEGALGQSWGGRSSRDAEFRC